MKTTRRNTTLTTTRTTTRTGLLCLLVFTFSASLVAAQTVQANFSWTVPTTGTAVDHYVVEQSVNGGAWTQVATVTTNSYALNATIGASHRLRVAGVDATSRQGPFSLPSTAYVPDAGAPGQPGKPIMF